MSQELFYIVNFMSGAEDISVINGFLSPWHGASSGCGWRNGLQIWRVTANILNKYCEQSTRGGPPAWRLGEVLTTPARKKLTLQRRPLYVVQTSGFSHAAGLHPPQQWVQSPLTCIVFELLKCELFLFIDEALCFQNIIVKIVCLECNMIYLRVNFPI
jgi:hypothetical protein